MEDNGSAVVTAPLVAGHTPGPWRFSELWMFPVTNIDHGDRRADGKIFHGYTISGSNEGGASILPVLASTHNFPGACLANARLIAAAPDLLAGLKAALPYMDTDGPRGAIAYDAALSAIAKASA